MFAPMLNPSGFNEALRTVIVRLSARIRSAVCASSRSSRPPTCACGATMTWPGLYGYLLRRTIAWSGRHTTRAASLSVGSSITRQNRQPGRGASVMYSMRHGAHSRSIDLRPLLCGGDGGLGMDLRGGQERDSRVSDAALPAAAIHPGVSGDGRARTTSPDAAGAARWARRGYRAGGRLPDPDGGPEPDLSGKCRVDNRAA